MPAEQIVLPEADHIELDRIIDRAEMRLEQYALHVQGLANDGRQTRIAQAEFQQELDALIGLRTYRRKSIQSASSQHIGNLTTPTSGTTMVNVDSHLSDPSTQQGSAFELGCHVLQWVASPTASASSLRQIPRSRP